MDYFSVLISVNKISIIFFAITVLFVAYEFYLFKRDSHKRKDIPVKVPTIRGSERVDIKVPALKALSADSPKKSKKANQKFLVMGVILTTIFGLLFAVSYIYVTKNSRKQTYTTQTRANVPTAFPTIPITPASGETNPTVLPTVGLTEEPTGIPASEETIGSGGTTEVSPTATPTPLVVADAGEVDPKIDEVSEEEIVVGEEEGVVEEESTPEASSDELIVAGNAYYSLVIFGASIAFILVAFVL